MKRFCKNVDITNIGFIETAITHCLSRKFRRHETFRLLRKYSNLTNKALIGALENRDFGSLEPAVNKLAAEISNNIKRKNIKLPPIIYRERRDGLSGKTRLIGKENILHQIYDYIAVDGMSELCQKRYGAHQYACIKTRGQTQGMQRISKWLKHDPKNTKYCLKFDIRHCYPSIPHDKLIGLLRRDIKNDNLLRLLELLINKYGEGLCIGSYLSAHLANYYLSFAYRYALEQIRIPVTRRGHTRQIRPFAYIAMYMDDVILLGSSKRHLKLAFIRLREYLKSELKLDAKDDWQLFRVAYKDKHGKARGQAIDMMGYRIGRDRVTVRRRIFLRIRRCLFRFRRRCSSLLARRLMSYYGWIVNSSCYRFYRRYRKIFKNARKLLKQSKRKEANKHDLYLRKRNGTQARSYQCAGRRRNSGCMA